MTQREKIVFAIIGGGWRADFFLRIAQALPERFEVCGMVLRRDEARHEYHEKWGVSTFASLEELLRSEHPSFVVVSVPRSVAPDFIKLAVGNGLAVLTETPPADTVEELIELNELVAHGATIQVAEQYHLQPQLRTQISIARSGLLGEVSQAQVSAAHDYHGVSLIRRFLGIGFEDAMITAHEFTSPVIMGPGRTGDPVEEETVIASQVIARLDFGDRLGIYDFTGEQYRSWIRAPRIHVRGLRGEITNLHVAYLHDFRSPMAYDIERVRAGENTNLEGNHLRGLRGGGEWLYRNEFEPARLFDDELAIASLLVGMYEHVNGGPDIYSLAEASQDQYLQLLIREAVASGQPVRTERQPWA
jgi:predicted dehydrogenase